MMSSFLIGKVYLIKPVLKKFTKKEQDVFRRLLDGKTQIEISKELGVSHACINHRVKSIRRKWNDYI